MPQPYPTGTEKRDGGNSFSLKTFGLVKKLVWKIKTNSFLMVSSCFHFLKFILLKIHMGSKNGGGIEVCFIIGWLHS